MFSSSIFGQTKDFNGKTDHQTLQGIFNQIHLPDSLMITNEFKGQLTECKILIELNKYINQNEKYQIEGEEACPVERSIIFQLNQNFIRIESITQVNSELYATIIFLKSDNTVIQEWKIKGKIN